ncbi:MAG: response regulator [Alphaproteobacteria bacterium]
MTKRSILKHVLVVDDDELVRTLTKELFERIGCTVSVAENGNFALAEISLRTPDLIILDIIMPEKEGLETLIQVKRKYPDMKVIAISGGGRKQIEDFLVIADRFGANVVLKKPIKPATLLDHAAQLLWGRSVSSTEASWKSK